MKRILLALAIIISITACTKSETPNPEPDPIIENTTSKSYVGCMRSDYPETAISGISVNDKIIYDLKSACTYNSIIWSTAYTDFYSGAFSLTDIVDCNIFPITTISVSTDKSNNSIFIYIPEKIFDENEIQYEFFDGKILTQTDNIKSINIKEAEVIPDNEYFKTDICKFDIEITIKYYNTIIEIVYYGESIHQYIIEGIR